MPACGHADDVYGAGTLPVVDDGASIPSEAAEQYPESLLRLRRQRCFTINDFDAVPRCIGAGKFGEPAGTGEWGLKGVDRGRVSFVWTSLPHPPSLPHHPPIRAGEVYKVRERVSRKVLVIKQVSKQALLDEGVVRQFQREVETHVRLDHAHVIKMFAYFHDQDYCEE